MRYARVRTTGLTLVEILIVLTVVAILLAMAVPTIAKVKNASGVDVSKSNLVTLSVAHAMYAADYNGRQYTLWPDDLTEYGNTYDSAFIAYWGHGVFDGALYFGWACGPNPGHYHLISPQVRSFNLRQPMGLGTTSNPHYGVFRVDNTADFNQYVNGRFYDSVFYAPNDTAVMEIVEPYFDWPCPYIFDISIGTFFTSYIRSPAALYHPDVMRRPSQGGWQDPWGTPGLLSLETRPLNGAQYADLKTHLIEHHWLQNRPDDFCIPDVWGPYNGCQPYYFNGGMASAPATLFYDGHVRLLPNAEVYASDQQVLKQTGGVDGLWSRDTMPFGTDGYFNQLSIDGTDLAHHILTTDGILGRDTLGPLELQPRDRQSRVNTNTTK